MNRRIWIVSLVLVLGFFALGQEEGVPLGIIVEPPTGELTVRIWVDKPVYAVGETIRIHFELNRPAYVYIWDIMPDGRVHLIFPNIYEPENFFSAGKHSIPSPGRPYVFRIQPPTGTEWLQIMATTVPIPFLHGYSPEQPFQLLGPDPQAWQRALEAQVLGIVPEPAQRAFDFTCFEIVYGLVPGHGTLQVLTTPVGAKLYVDGVFRGYTPRTLILTAGIRSILIRKPGYQDYVTTIYLMPGGIRILNITLVLVVVVNQPPLARFTFTPLTPRAGDLIHFDASASSDPDGTIVNYQWDFQNDGVFDATGRTASFRYPAAGTYTVRLVVTDNQGASASTTLTMVVSPLVVNQPPVARFTFTPLTPRAGDLIHFDASASSDPDGTIVNYQWDFQNDGVFDATGRTASFRYPAAGTYTVRLVVTDNQGASASTTLTMVVSPLVVNQPPLALFEFSPSSPLVNQPVTFNATRSYDPDGRIIDYRWDLNGDGVVDQSGPVVVWTYPAPGTYTVTLWVTDNLGAISSVTKTVSVGAVGIPGMPPMFGIPGIYVWGTDRWYITVNGSPTWTIARNFRIELRTDGEFVGVSPEGPAPLGLVPEPITQGWRIVLEGSVSTDMVTYSFSVRNATTIYFDLRLDMDGDGTLDLSPAVARLRQRMVNPPRNPFVVGIPEGYTGPFIPAINFRIGAALAYTQTVRIIFWQTTIAALEGS